jgi:hypothetical protein
VLGYVRDTAERYPETQEFARYIDTRVDSAFQAAQARTAAA